MEWRWPAAADKIAPALWASTSAVRGRDDDVHIYAAGRQQLRSGLFPEFRRLHERRETVEMPGIHVWVVAQE